MNEYDDDEYTSNTEEDSLSIFPSAV